MLAARPVEAQPALVKRVPIDRIRPALNAEPKLFGQDRLNVLAESMRQHGLFEPIQVRSVEGVYEIVSGERRWRAARLLGWRSIDTVVEPPLSLGHS